MAKPLLISHRGNIWGPSFHQENSPSYVMHALAAGYNVEIDVWFIDKEFFLGHDKPEHFVTYEFLNNPKFFVHCKNIEAFQKLNQIRPSSCWFFHQEDAVTLTVNGKGESFVWVHPKTGVKLGDTTINVVWDNPKN